MKIYPETRLHMAELTSHRARPQTAPGGYVFKPLSAPAIYDDRIDLDRNTRVAPRRAYPYKRFDQAVN